ncbi:MAG: hypothetical protein KDC38_18125, partial [Planctomycetes bacterium]|nr:hypothetical protein [Planctomycetota bacterium]
MLRLLLTLVVVAVVIALCLSLDDAPTVEVASRTARPLIDSSAPEEIAPIEIPATRPDVDETVDLHGYRAGDRLRYRLRQARSVTVRASASFGTDTQDEAATEMVSGFESATTGVLSVVIYEASADGGLFGFAIESADVRMATSDMADPAEREVIGNALAQEVLATIDAHGQVDRILFPAGLPVDAELLWRDLLARWQIVYPDSSAADEWWADEDDATGLCSVAYTRRGPSIEKSRVEYRHYHHVATTQGVAANRTSPVGDIAEVIGYEVERIPTRASGRGTASIDLRDGRHTVDAEVEFDLDLASLEQDEAIGDAAAIARGRFDRSTTTTLAVLRVPPTPSRPEEPATRDAVIALLAELRLLVERNGASDPAVVSAMARLADMIRRRDDAVELAVEALGGDPPKGLTAVVYGALGTAGTPAAQLALRAVFTDDPNRRGRFAALTSFVQVESPLPEVDDELLGLFESDDPLGGSALLVLGAVGSKIVHEDPTRLEQIERSIVAVLDDPR